MKKAVIYIHGKGGSAAEAEHYREIFRDYDVYGLDYQATTPWECRAEMTAFYDNLARQYEQIELVANSIGAYLAMNALADKKIKRAFFISPIVDMERLIGDMLIWAGKTEQDLAQELEIETSFGEILFWKYLCYTRKNPLVWDIPTFILYGDRDNLTAYETIADFAKRVNADLTVYQNGEHWFHTEAEMAFLDDWLGKILPAPKA